MEPVLQILRDPIWQAIRVFATIVMGISGIIFSVKTSRPVQAQSTGTVASSRGDDDNNLANQLRYPLSVIFIAFIFFIIITLVIPFLLAIFTHNLFLFLLAIIINVILLIITQTSPELNCSYIIGLFVCAFECSIIGWFLGLSLSSSANISYLPLLLAIVGFLFSLIMLAFMGFLSNALLGIKR